MTSSPRRPALRQPAPRRLLGLVLAGLVVVAAACGTIPQAGSSSTAGQPSGAASTAPSGAVPSGAVPSGAVPSGAEESSAEGGAETCEYVASGDAAKPVQLPKATEVLRSGTVTYVIKTNEGDVNILMDRSKAPCTINSFESLATQGYYNDTKCHRLADSGIFVLQCGDPTGTGRGGPGYTFADETDGEETYTAGVVAMANAGANTNGSQFFLVYQDSTSLDATPNYTIFGTMDKASLDVVNRIYAEGQDGSNPDGTGKPNNPAEIISVTKK